MNKTFVILGLLSVLSFARAEEAEPRFEITPFGGYRLGGSIALDDASFSRLELDDGSLYGLAAGMNVHEGLLEIMWAHQDSSIRAVPIGSVTAESFDMNVDQFHFNGLYYPPGFEATQPYAIAGLGATRYAPTSVASDSIRFSWALGGGMKFLLSRRLALRLEAKWNPALSSGSGSVFCNSSTGRCYVTASGQVINQFDFTAGLTVRL